MAPSSWFQIHPLAPHLWAIDDHGLDVMYLVTGAERAMLVDTGMGIGDLACEVQAITQLPLWVVNTHGHVDHVTGNGQFAQVFIHDADRDAVTEPWSVEDRAMFVQHFFTGEHAHTPPPDFVEAAWGARVAGEILPVEAGQVFDLGGRQLEAIHLPGHTAGSMGFLDRQARLALVGDAVLDGVWMQLRESTPLSAYHQALVCLLAEREAFDWMYSGHHLQPFPAADLAGFAEGIGQIVAGELVGEAEHTFAGDGLRWNYQSLGVLYRADRLQEKAG